MASGPPTEESSSSEHGPPKLEDFVPVIRPRPSSEPATSHRWDSWLPLLNNRLILSGLGLVVVLLLIAIVLVSIGHGNEDGHSNILGIRTPDANSTALPRGGLSGRVLTTASVRNGPNATYSLLGTIPRGATIAVIGRNEDISWLQIRYSPGSSLRGWIDAQFLDISGDVSQLAVAGPGPVPAVAVPTESEFATAVPTEQEATSTPTEEQTPGVTVTPTPTLGARPTPTEQPQPTPTLASKPTATPGG